MKKEINERQKMLINGMILNTQKIIAEFYLRHVVQIGSAIGEQVPFDTAYEKQIAYCAEKLESIDFIHNEYYHQRNAVITGLHRAIAELLQINYPCTFELFYEGEDFPVDITQGLKKYELSDFYARHITTDDDTYIIITKSMWL